MEHAVIVDVEPSTAVRQAEVTAAKTMIERTHHRFDLWPERLIADTGYGSAEMLNWLVNDRGIEPHIPVFDKSKRTDDTFSREDFVYDHASDTYRCAGGKILRRYRRRFTLLPPGSPAAGLGNLAKVSNSSGVSKAVPQSTTAPDLCGHLVKRLDHELSGRVAAHHAGDQRLRHICFAQPGLFFRRLQHIVLDAGDMRHKGEAVGRIGRYRMRPDRGFLIVDGSRANGATFPVLTEGSVSRSPSQSYENTADD